MMPNATRRDTPRALPAKAETSPDRRDPPGDFSPTLQSTRQARRPHGKGMQGVSGWWQSHKKMQLNYGLGGELCLPIPAARRWDQATAAEGSGDARGSPGMGTGRWVGIHFSQRRSGKGKQMERYPESMQSTWDFLPLLIKKKKSNS